MKPKLTMPVQFFSIILVLYVSSGHAEYNSEKLGIAAGAYVEAANNIARIKDSKCAYRLEDEEFLQVYSLEESIEHVVPFMRNSDRIELWEWLQEEGNAAARETEGLVRGFIERRLDDGLSVAETCDLLVSRSLNLLRDSRKNWKNTVWSYGKSDLWCEAIDVFDGRLTGRMVEDDDPDLLARTFRFVRETGAIEGTIIKNDNVEKLIVRNTRKEFDSGYMGSYGITDLFFGTQGVSDLRIDIDWFGGFEFSFKYYETFGGMKTGTCLPIEDNECHDAWDCLSLLESNRNK